MSKKISLRGKNCIQVSATDLDDSSLIFITMTGYGVKEKIILIFFLNLIELKNNQRLFLGSLIIRHQLDSFLKYIFSFI